jgi:hypothetical protein
MNHEFIYATSIAGSILLGLFTLWHSRRTIYVNAVTAERSKWIEKLRQNIAEFAGLTHYWVASKVEDRSLERQSDESESILRQLDKLRMLIRLQLNPQGEIDQRILRLITDIPNLTHHPETELLVMAEEQLIAHAQWLLKAEWEKVKVESGGMIAQLLRPWRDARYLRRYRRFCALIDKRAGKK